MIHRLKFPTKASFTKAVNALYPLDDEGNRIIPSGQVLVEIGIMYERRDNDEPPAQLDGYHADIVIWNCRRIWSSTWYTPKTLGIRWRGYEINPDIAIAGGLLIESGCRD